ncbi:thiamine biosynthesis protein ThiF [Nitzschia inconspicua]|uniref:Thiamine biosynthesis protein ThiF n=1 Tax=Nitzschia inconspicua TaxID=303405 RepID=A0A9K3M321_9STRA|nr:thiamine biosynthesis protein ThiF [Nitzschia inconspicua]
MFDLWIRLRLFGVFLMGLSYHCLVVSSFTPLAIHKRVNVERCHHRRLDSSSVGTLLRPLSVTFKKADEDEDAAAAVSVSFHNVSTTTTTTTTITDAATTDLGDPFTQQQQQRQLRFGGVGRLYSQSSTGENDDDDSNDSDSILQRLERAHVLVVGLGGVGSWAAEALCRSGIGSLTLIDLDDICISNTNRQLHTTVDNIGKLKINVMKDRLQSIHPECRVHLIHDFVNADNIHDILSSQSTTPPTVCLDAIDGSRSKTALLAACVEHGIPVVTCGGSAGRTDPTRFIVQDLTKVHGDPLLNACRKNLRKYHGFPPGVDIKQCNSNNNNNNKKSLLPKEWNIFAVYSQEPQKVVERDDDSTSSSSLRRCDGALGTACFVTGTSGFVAAAKVVEMIAKNQLVPPINPSSKSKNI